MARPKLRGPRDFWSGVLFASLGAVFGVVALTYEQGSATRMGAGYFPCVLAAILFVVGVALAARSLLIVGAPVGGMAIGPIVLVLGATLGFGLLLHGAGIAVALAVVVLVSARASIRFRWKSAIVLAIVVTAASILLFVHALRLPVPILGRWLTG